MMMIKPKTGCWCRTYRCKNDNYGHFVVSSGSACRRCNNFM